MNKTNNGLLLQLKIVYCNPGNVGKMWAKRAIMIDDDTQFDKSPHFHTQSIYGQMETVLGEKEKFQALNVCSGCCYNNRVGFLTGMMSS